MLLKLSIVIYDGRMKGNYQSANWQMKVRLDRAFKNTSQTRSLITFQKEEKRDAVLINEKNACAGSLHLQCI